MGHANDTNKLIQQFICQFISITNLIEYDSRGSNNNPSSMAMQVKRLPPILDSKDERRTRERQQLSHKLFDLISVSLPPANSEVTVPESK